jgi:hypothetical protein
MVCIKLFRGVVGSSPLLMDTRLLLRDKNISIPWSNLVETKAICEIDNDRKKLESTRGSEMQTMAYVEIKIKIPSLIRELAYPSQWPTIRSQFPDL